MCGSDEPRFNKLDFLIVPFPVGRSQFVLANFADRRFWQAADEFNDSRPFEARDLRRTELDQFMF